MFRDIADLGGQQMSDRCKLAMVTLNFLAEKHNLSRTDVYLAWVTKEPKIMAQFGELMELSRQLLIS